MALKRPYQYFMQAAVAVALLHAVTPTSIAQNPTPTITPTGIQAAIRQSLQSETAFGNHAQPRLQPTGSPPALPKALTGGAGTGRLNQYRGRALEMPEPSRAGQDYGQLDLSKSMWWDDVLERPLGFAPNTMSLTLGDLTQVALESSPLVKSILADPMIRRSDVVVADAEFDPTVFLEGKFVDTNEPIGNALTTGDGSNRFRDENFSTGYGLRKRTRTGGQLEIAQRSGFQENNSIFLTPNPQATSRMEINFTQPLLRDGGRAVNNVRIVLAQLDVQIANSQVRSRLERHLTDVTAAYWSLHQARAEWIQRTQLLAGAKHLHDVIKARGGVDAQQRQILRAEVAVATRQSDLIRRATRVRNAQARLRFLTGSPQLKSAANIELTPIDRPLLLQVPISTRDSVITALDNRWDVAESIRQIQSVSTRIGAAKNQVLPKLDLILGGYVSGLDSNRDTFGAWTRQYSDGRPSYSVGLQYELPVRNRANKARLIRNRWEFSQAIADFQQTMEKTFTEVEIAVRETETAYAEMVAKQKSVLAAGNEVRYLQQRWDILPNPEESAILLIEDLLDAQERLANEEQAFVSAQVGYAMSWIGLRRTMGILLRIEDVKAQREEPAEVIINENLPPDAKMLEGDVFDTHLAPQP